MSVSEEIPIATGKKLFGLMTDIQDRLPTNPGTPWKKVCDLYWINSGLLRKRSNDTNVDSDLYFGAGTSTPVSAEDPLCLRLCYYSWVSLAWSCLSTTILMRSVTKGNIVE